MIPEQAILDLCAALKEFYPERADLQALVATVSRTGERKTAYQVIDDKSDVPCQIVPLNAVEGAGTMNYSQSHAQSTHVCVLWKPFDDLTTAMRLQIWDGAFIGIYNILEVKNASFGAQTLLEIQITK